MCTEMCKNGHKKYSGRRSRWDELCLIYFGSCRKKFKHMSTYVHHLFSMTIFLTWLQICRIFATLVPVVVRWKNTILNTIFVGDKGLFQFFLRRSLIQWGTHLQNLHTVHSSFIINFTSPHCELYDITIFLLYRYVCVTLHIRLSPYSLV